MAVRDETVETGRLIDKPDGAIPVCVCVDRRGPGQQSVDKIANYAKTLGGIRGGYIIFLARSAQIKWETSSSNDLSAVVCPY